MDSLCLGGAGDEKDDPDWEIPETVAGVNVAHLDDDAGAGELEAEGVKRFAAVAANMLRFRQP